MPAYITIIRPLNGVMAAFAAWIGTLVGGAALYPSLPVLLGLLTVFLISCGGMAINDYYDAEIDKLNKPKRPIPSGKISRKAALCYAIVLFAAGIAASYFISLNALAVAAFAAVLLAAYSARLKKMLLVGHLAISLLVALSFVFGGIVAGNYLPTLLMALLAFLSNTAREVYKSIEDILGDKKHNVVSLPVRFGVLKAKLVANAFVIVSIIFSFIPYALGIFGQTYLLFVAIADIGFVSAVIAPARYSAKLCKVSMLIALIAFLAGAIRI